MRHDFDIDHLHRILANCPEYEADHHLDRPFMSAYQIAIRFAEEHPNHDLVRTLPLGGEGTGTNQSLTQRIARFLSQAIRDGTAGALKADSYRMRASTTSASATEVAAFAYPHFGPLMPIRSFVSGVPHPTGHREVCSSR